jgi:hypothetical protein
LKSAIKIREYGVDVPGALLLDQLAEQSEWHPWKLSAVMSACASDLRPVVWFMVARSASASPWAIRSNDRFDVGEGRLHLRNRRWRIA